MVRKKIKLKPKKNKKFTIENVKPSVLGSEKASKKKILYRIKNILSHIPSKFEIQSDPFEISSQSIQKNGDIRVVTTIGIEHLESDSFAQNTEPFNADFLTQAFSQDTADNYGKHEILDNIFTSPVITHFESTRKFPRIHSRSPKIKTIVHESFHYETVPAEEPVEDIFAKPNYIELLDFRIPRNSHRMLMVFSCICLFLLAPIFGAMYYQKLNSVKGLIVGDSLEAFRLLEQGKVEALELNFNKAAQYFQNSQENFELAKNRFENQNFFTRFILISLPFEKKNITAGLNLLSTGEGIAELGHNISVSLNEIFQENSTKDAMNYFEHLKIMELSIQTLLPKIAQAESSLGFVSEGSDNPELLAAAEKIPEVEESLKNFSLLLSSLLEISGSKGWTRNLILFQNNNELRPSGGFLGSYALLDLENGKVKNLEVPAGGSYDLSGSQLSLNASPYYLHPANPRLDFQDANIYFDFPTTAKKVAKILEQAKGPSVDAVVAINASFVEELLEVIGPLKLEGYDTEFTAINFVDEVTKIVEVEYNKELNKPKQILSDLAPLVINKIQNLEKEKLARVGEIFYNALRKKDIMIFSFVDTIQKILESLKWDGSMQKSENGVDYLAIIHTNVGGQKSDAKMQETIRHEISFDENDESLHTLILNRAHNGVSGEPFTGVQNRSYTRMYVPPGSVLIDAEGFDVPDAEWFTNTPAIYSTDEDIANRESVHFFDSALGVEIYNESDKTVFAGWIMVDPGQTKNIKVTYKVAKIYSYSPLGYGIIIQKQPGSQGSIYHLEIKAPDNKTITKIFPENTFFDSSIAVFDTTLLTDVFLGVQLNKKNGTE